MSQAKPNCVKHTAAQADEGNVASRTRRQTRMRARDDDGEEKQQAPHSSAHVSPAMRIYRHALEAIFGMLALNDLTRILAVSRAWSAAVRSMKPILAPMAYCSRQPILGKRFHPLPPIARLIDSPLLRHLSAIQLMHEGAWTPLNNASLGLLAQHAPNLTSLFCDLTLTPNVPLIFPAKLQSLKFELQGEYTDAVINSVLTTLAGLPSLSRAAAAIDSSLSSVQRMAYAGRLRRAPRDGSVRAQTKRSKLRNASVSPLVTRCPHNAEFRLTTRRRWPHPLLAFLFAVRRSIRSLPRAACGGTVGGGQAQVLLARMHASRYVVAACAPLRCA